MQLKHLNLTTSATGSCFFTFIKVKTKSSLLLKIVKAPEPRSSKRFGRQLRRSMSHWVGSPNSKPHLMVARMPSLIEWEAPAL